MEPGGPTLPRILMAEIIDQANDLVEQRLSVALENMRIDHTAISATHCIECGDAIKEARRKAYPGCTLCVLCKGEQEARGRHQAKN